MKLNKNLVYSVIILVVCFISYSNILGNGFVWDDSAFIVDRPEIRKFSLMVNSLGGDEYGIYRPLRTVFYFFAYQMFELNPVMYHLLAILLHASVSILLFFIVKKMFSSKLALLSSLLFAVHPIHVGRVANATASFDIFGILFYLLAFYCYIVFRKDGKKNFLYYSIVLFLLGLFASEELFSFPFLILLYEFVFSEKGLKKYFKSVSYFVFLVLFVLFRFFIVKVVSRVSEYPGGSFLVTMLTMPKVILNYILLIIAPFGLTPFRRVDFVYNVFSIWFIVPFLVLVGLVCLVYKYRKNKMLLFFSGFFVVTMLPFLNIMPLQKIMAERYFYLASFAVLVLIGYLFIYLEKKVDKKVVYSLFFVVLVLLGSLTIYNNTFWHDEFKLMNRGITLNPYDSKAHNNLGNIYFNQKDYDNALIHFKNAVNYRPDNQEAWMNLGVLYSVLGEHDKSIEALEKSIDLTPYNHEAYDKLGITYLKMDDLENAEKLFKNSVYFEEDYAPALTHLGVVYGRQKDFEKAAAYFQRAIEANPYYAEAYYNFGLLYEAFGKTKQANALKAKAMELDGSYLDVS
jgi:tetratricopeptide (TPR) repeat protein